ncbi:MAG: DUF3021 domain-containing protein [Lachnospiraceae bacterium]|nr:DUF3021 domain-containing protein [Lachnospiraceae bacterium]
MKRLKDMLFIYMCVTTCVLFVTALYITVFWPQVQLGVEILWQILVVSFLCSVANCIVPHREVSARMMLAIYILRYAATNAIVLGCGFRFGWFYADNLPMVLAMLLSIGAVFVIVSAAAWRQGKQQAALMNERLQAYQSKE